MEELLARLVKNGVTMTMVPVRQPNHVLCIKFSKVIDGKEYALDFYMDILTMKDGSYHIEMLNVKLDEFIRCCEYMTMPLDTFLESW